MTEDRPRKYDNSRRQNTAHERVLEAALSVARETGTWNWDGITFKAVSDAAGVSERTVYRHFPAQRDLHEAMMARINEQAGISYDDLTLTTFPDMVDRLFRSMATFARRPPRSSPTPTMIAMDDERIEALLSATGGDVRHAAVLDLLWSTATYERLAQRWGMSLDQAAETISWVAGLVNEGTTPPLD